MQHSRTSPARLRGRSTAAFLQGAGNALSCCTGLPLDPLADPSDPATPYRFWFRGAVDPSLQLLVPSSALYIMQVRLSSAGTGGSGGLSTGAVVGIALGATAAAAAAAGLLWWGLAERRRQRRRSQGLVSQLKAAAEEGCAPSDSVSRGSAGMAGSGSSGGSNNSTRPVKHEPANEPLLPSPAPPGPQLSPRHAPHSSGSSGDRPLNWAGCDLPPLPELVQVSWG